MKGVELELPLPPTVNHMWLRRGNRTFASSQYRKFKLDVAKQWQDTGQPKLTGRLAYEVLICYPNKLTNDISNRLKALEDALKGYLFEDDEQIDQITVKRGPIVPGGCAVFRMWEITQPQ